MNPLLLLWMVLQSALAGWPDLSEDLPRGGEGAQDAAVIVAIERYLDVADVQGAVANAEDWRRWLHVSRGVPLGNIHLLRDRDATREMMLDEADWAASRVGEGGTLWWVFIGHGAPSEDGQDGVLVGSDARQTARSLYARSVSRNELLQRLDQGRQAHTLVVLDACFSGRSGEDMLVPGMQPLIPVSLPETRATVLSAGRGDEFAGPLPGARRPAFSYLVLGALRGWGDLDGDGKVTVSEAVRYAEGALSALVSDRRQTPQLQGPHHDLVLARAHEEGPDLLALAARPAPPPPVTGQVAFDLGDLGAVGEALQREACEAEAREAVQAQEAEAARQAVAARGAELAAQWGEVRTAATPCAESQDEGLRARCRERVEAFAAFLAEQEVARPAGFREAQTACGPIRVPVPAQQLPLDEALSAGVQAYLEGYGPDHRRGPVMGPWAGSWSGYDMRWVHPGTFTIGEGAPDAWVGRQVELTRGFYVGTVPVTQGLWKRVMGANPAESHQVHWGGRVQEGISGQCNRMGFKRHGFDSGFQLVGDDLPVMCVSWHDAVRFANALSQRDGLRPAYRISGDEVTWDRSANGYRLLTDAEWEHAARAGSTERYVGTSDPAELCRFGNVQGQEAERFQYSLQPQLAPCDDGYGALAPVGSFEPNGWGLHDLVGNVREWTFDGAPPYRTMEPGVAAVDPLGPTSASAARGLRGGSFRCWVDDQQISNPNWAQPHSRIQYVGFRLARSEP